MANTHNIDICRLLIGVYAHEGHAYEAWRAKVPPSGKIVFWGELATNTATVLCLKKSTASWNKCCGMLTLQPLGQGQIMPQK
eukprot:355132-Chlamydomonas_euryale.AAC.2